MVKHIVMWRFKEEIKEADKEALKDGMQKGLESLPGKIPGLISLKFQRDLLPKSTHDMALVSEFTDAQALSGYGGHPEHVAVADTYVRPFVCDRSCLDYQE